jgi:hypothetical protein
MTILLKIRFYRQAPGTILNFTTMRLLRTKHPRQNERNAIGSLGHGGGGAGQNQTGKVGRTTRDSPATGLWAWLGVEGAGEGGSAAPSGSGRGSWCSGEGAARPGRHACRGCWVDARQGAGVVGRLWRRMPEDAQRRRPWWTDSRARHRVRRARARRSATALNRGVASCFGAKTSSNLAVARCPPW